MNKQIPNPPNTSNSDQLFTKTSDYKAIYAMFTKGLCDLLNCLQNMRMDRINLGEKNEKFGRKE